MINKSKLNQKRKLKSQNLKNLKKYLQTSIKRYKQALFHQYLKRKWILTHEKLQKNKISSL